MKPPCLPLLHKVKDYKKNEAILPGHNMQFMVNRSVAALALSASLLATSAVRADQTHIEVAACKLSLQDMVRQPKDKPLVLAETMMNCGKHGQHSLEVFYGQGWQLIQVVSDDGAGARVAIFERSRQ
jgi:hypothetical protein